MENKTEEQVVEIVGGVDPEAVGYELRRVSSEAKLTQDESDALRIEFAGYYNRITDWRNKIALITNPDDVRQQKLAREIRLGLKEVRCDVERARKSLKEDAVRRGKAIDGYANVLKYLCEPVEEKLSEIENRAALAEADRIAKMIESRTAMILSEGGDPTIYNLGQMTDDAFSVIMQSCKDARIKREEEAQRIEAERVAKEKADAEERERQKIENERLRKEAAEREAVAQAERAKAAAEKKALEAKLNAEREAKEKAEADARYAKQAEEDRLRKEREDEQERLRKERLAREAAQRAPDKEKLEAFCVQILTPKVDAMSTEAGKTVASEAMRMQAKMVAWIRSQIEKM